MLEPPGSRALQIQPYLTHWDTDHGDTSLHHVPILAEDRLLLTAESQFEILKPMARTMTENKLAWHKTSRGDRNT